MEPSDAHQSAAHEGQGHPSPQPQPLQSGDTLREAQVDLHGGFVLDLPSWLQTVVQQLSTWRSSARPYQTADARIKLLRETLQRARTSAEVAPETLATLHLEFALANLEYLSADRSHQIEVAIVACEAALQVSTRARYPRQYGNLQITLGHAYRERIIGVQRDNREQALQYYQQALALYTREDDPLHYAQIQHGLALSYQLRINGKTQDNLETSIAHCQQALSIYNAQSFPFEHAQTMLTLSKAYLQRIKGERRDNLEQAISCCREATELLTSVDTPVEYAQAQSNLAAAFSQRIAGERRDNLEQAISCYHAALQIYTIDTFPVEYARVQNNLGIAYWQRPTGERRQNLEHAIDCYQRAAAIFTADTFPYQYAMLQNNLGTIYVVRLAEKRRDNLEQAIACYHAALQVWTQEAFPLQYGKLQNNLGEVYQLRLAGTRADNLEHSITYYQEALRIFTSTAFPTEHAMAQQNLGTVYKERQAGGREENLSYALACYQNALEIYTLNAFPSEHRQLHLDRAETLALHEDWLAVHEAYSAAQKAEDLLVALSTGAVGLDTILKEGRDATVRDGFALMRLGRVAEAALTIERGRARGLAQAMQIYLADPARIQDPERRTRYVTVHDAFIEAQTLLHAPLPPSLDEQGQRQLTLERMAAYRTSKAAFDAIIEEIHTVGDPPSFFVNALEPTALRRIVEGCGPDHALVYLAATPWGGYAVAALPYTQEARDKEPFVALDLPALTNELINTLVRTPLGDETEDSIGGFYCAQSGKAFEALQSFAGNTFREKAAHLYENCITHGKSGTLDSAAQFVLSLSGLTPFTDAALSSLSAGQTALLSETLCHAVLQRELQRCQTVLSNTVIEPFAAWLLAMGIASFTLVPCGPLALLPLGSMLLPDGQTLAEKLPMSITPSARALLHAEQDRFSRAGIYALGNPYPTRQELRWSEAEALTLALLGQQSSQSTGVQVQWQATRSWLIDVLHKGYVVNASCHGLFDAQDFLRSRLVLANAETLTLADMLSHQADLRGLRLLILSACQTAILALQGAYDEVRSLASGMLQAGASAVLATLWAVDDRATYLLMVRFAQEWFPRLYDEPPALALARAQHWLRTVTNRELQSWQALLLSPSQTDYEIGALFALSGDTLEQQEQDSDMQHALVTVRGRSNRFDVEQAQELVQDRAEAQDAPDHRPYADPYYWAGFQITGW